MPASWIKNQIAGKEWLRSFRRRPKDLSLQKPEPCSLARATSFNRTNFESFYKNLENLLGQNPLFKDGTRIFNLDETSTTTVQKSQRVKAPKDETICCIISASGLAEKKIVKKVLVSDSDEENPDRNVPYQESDDDNEWSDDDMEKETVGLTENDLKEPPIEGLCPDALYQDWKSTPYWDELVYFYD
ncbi:unnamed protein product [Leptidea sinapis]|uniref:HTH CENPB-type domain-containing protein n=1 Tax=Leptidea sinapis TaxID=189913 RepID=A0A5E4QPJ2_9NEOP|nr:unnamed protein product [Leptidea sinapis]